MVNYKVTTTVFGERPDFKEPRKILQELGRDGFGAMMDRFYDIVVESDIANFFPQDKDMLDKVKKHNTKFFVEACGGEKEYTKEVGHIDMVEMHKPFSIPEKARVEWLGCMRELLEELNISDEAKQEFWDYCEVFSKHMVNKPTNLEAHMSLADHR
ncbi:MAG: globin [Arcobacteraceae bacterium]|nr:globin [Arcobacteraceae bacterium]